MVVSEFVSYHNVQLSVILMDAQSYRELQLASVTGHGGGSETEILAVVAWPAAAVAFQRALPLDLQSWPVWLAALWEYALFVLPQVAFFIWPGEATQIFLLPALVIGLLNVVVGLARARPAPLPRRLPILTHARMTIMLLSTIAVFAVDFSVFPRRFVRTESFGVSLMDVGVGTVLASLGISASRFYLGANSPPLSSVVRSTIPAAVLGIVRMYFVKATDYQEHVSEYGVHWNFFMTLSIVPVVTHAMMTIASPEVGALVLICVYESALQKFGLYDMLLSNQRDSLAMANKEGLASIVGYTAITLAFVAVGQRFYSLRSSTEMRQKITTFILPRIAMFALMYFCCRSVGLNPSRRLANLPYVLGVCALGYIQYALLAISEAASNARPAGPLSEAISRNQLAFFLFGNVLTGAINLSMQTLLVPKETALAIIIGYSAAVCIFAMLVRNYNLRL